jgi:phosphoglycolate phosphatase-like HAD superfamily hydrolase
MDIYTSAFAQVVAEQMGLARELGQEIFLRTAGLPLDQQFKLVRKKAGKRARSFSIEELMSNFWRIVGTLNISPIANAYEVIRALSLAGYTLVVSSSSTPEVVTTRVKAIGIAPYFRLILGTDYATRSMAKGKSHFRVIRRTLAISLSDFRKHTILVGDGLHDAQIAREAGILFIRKINAVNLGWAYDLQPDYEIKDLFDLILLLSKTSNQGKVFVPLASLSESHSF